MSAAARTLPMPEEPLDVAPGEDLPVELLELTDAANARKHGSTAA